MTSVTRSTRRTEGFPHTQTHRRGQSQHSQQQHLIATAQAQNILPRHVNSSRPKRRFDPLETHLDMVRTKRARISVDIPSKPSLRTTHAVHPVGNATIHGPVASTDAGATPLNPSQPPPAPPTPAAAATTVKPEHPNLTKHQEKVVNGLKHELNRLQPARTNAREQGRKLRSQEATRFRSELAAYFPDYDEVIGNDPKEQRKPAPPSFSVSGLSYYCTKGLLTSISSRFRYFKPRHPDCHHRSRVAQ